MNRNTTFSKASNRTIKQSKQRNDIFNSTNSIACIVPYKKQKSCSHKENSSSEIKLWKSFNSF